MSHVIIDSVLALIRFETLKTIVINLVCGGRTILL